MIIRTQSVQMLPLKKITNERGYLTEIQRTDDTHYPGFGQAYITETKPGIVKAWYRHTKQTDQISLIRGSVLLVIYDTRENSPDFCLLKEFYITEKEPKLVQIPPGVWHGFMARSSEPALLLHLNTVPWNPDFPDEERISPYDHTIPYLWPV